jgi:hypothetical protein
MGKIEHLQFLVLMIPTFLILGAAAVSMADLAFPASGAPEQSMAVAVVSPVHPAELGRDDSPAE